MCITFIGSLVIIYKKVNSRQIIQRIPKSNILPQPTNYQQDSFQMATIHSAPGVTQGRTINENNTGDLLFIVHNSRVFLQRQILIINYYIKG